MEYTKGELYLVSETEYDHIIYLRDKPNRRDKIMARFINEADATLFLSGGDMYEALRKIRALSSDTILYDIANRAITKAEKPSALVFLCSSLWQSAQSQTISNGSL